MKDYLNDTQQELYVEALSALNAADLDFMLGGALAVYHYTGWWRSTHDVDVYVTPDDVTKAQRALADAGFTDLGEQAAGDREWITHAGKGPIIVDVIWRFANLANYVLPDWLDRGPRGSFLDIDVKFLPLEELIWIKLFVINRHRCDWPDIMRVVRAQCLEIEWPRLLDMIGEHWLLLAGLVDVFDWQFPGSMDCIPDAIRVELGGRRTVYRAGAAEVNREQLLDPWLNQRADSYAIRSDE
jgi:hypothetical protein